MNFNGSILKPKPGLKSRIPDSKESKKKSQQTSSWADSNVYVLLNDQDQYLLIYFSHLLLACICCHNAITKQWETRQMWVQYEQLTVFIMKDIINKYISLFTNCPFCLCSLIKNKCLILRWKAWIYADDVLTNHSHLRPTWKENMVMTVNFMWNGTVHLKSLYHL